MEKKTKKGLKKIIGINLKVIVSTIILTLLNTVSFAGSIGTAEVTQATEKIKNAVVSLAMPIRWNFNVCKYCNNSFKDDIKFK